MLGIPAALPLDTGLRAVLREIGTEAIVAEPLLTTVNQYVRLKLDAGQSPGAVEKPETSSFSPFPSPSAVEPDGHPFNGSDHP